MKDETPEIWDRNLGGDNAFYTEKPVSYSFKMAIDWATVACKMFQSMRIGAGIDGLSENGPVDSSKLARLSTSVEKEHLVHVCVGPGRPADQQPLEISAGGQPERYLQHGSIRATRGCSKPTPAANVHVLFPS